MTTTRLWIALPLVAMLAACGGASKLHSDDARQELRDCRRTGDNGACVDVANRLTFEDEADRDIALAQRLHTRVCRDDPRRGCAGLAALALTEPEAQQDIDTIVEELERGCRRYAIDACDLLIVNILENENSGAYDPEYGQAIRDRLCADGFVHYCFRDTDGDGINDDVDECPEVPEDFDGFENGDGCPDLDNDQDGILDEDDACPDIAEDADGFEDSDGCIDFDNDQDGILDVDDACPDLAEDVDGFEDDDGCIDFDNDQDGQLDGDDECPDEAEDYDGFEDGDGCPEEGEGLVALTCDAIVIADKVYFDTDSDVIQERSFDLLNQVADVLNSVSYITLIEIAGHTDDRGDDDYNLDLSQRRADSVRTYLLGAGVADDRMRAVGYGETTPIAPNTTADGRSENRRVGFDIVEQSSACE